MRKLTILLFILFAISNAQAQSEVMEYIPLKDFDFRVADYIKYNFEERKEAYIGKPLSELLKDCEVPVKSRLGHGLGRVAGHYGTSFYFENDDICNYRIFKDKGGLDMPEIMVHWRDTIFCPFRGRFRDEMLAWYSEQIVADIETFGKNFSELPKVELEEELPAPTPCCSPVLVAGDETVKQMLADKYVLLDQATFVAGGRKPDTAFVQESVKLDTLFYVAENSFQVHSIKLVDSPTIEKHYLEFGVPDFSTCCYNSTQTYQTVPKSPYGWYQFPAPRGYDLYRYMLNRFRGRYLVINEVQRCHGLYKQAFFIAYDGSVSVLRATDETKIYTIPQNNGFSNEQRRDVCDYELTYNKPGLHYPEDVQDISTIWGFMDGARLQDEFIDAFLRIYDEGAHFSKEDAYNAAYAYILQNRGIELYRRALGWTSFKCYNTTPIYESGTAKISGFKSKIK